MLRLNVLFASVVAVLPGLLVCQGGRSQDVHTIRQRSTTAAERGGASFAVELDRAIAVLKRGLAENWKTREQYLNAFAQTPSTDSKGRKVTHAKESVACAMGVRLRVDQIWDEGPPLGVEVERAISEFTELRQSAEQTGNAKDGTAEFSAPACAVSPPVMVRISPGVATSLLKTRTEPVNPADAHVSGTVVLHATIGAAGRVEGLRVLSGPVMLQQAALEAVRQWTYWPYRLNDKAVEFETVINVVFASRR